MSFRSKASVNPSVGCAVGQRLSRSGVIEGDGRRRVSSRREHRRSASRSRRRRAFRGPAERRSRRPARPTSTRVVRRRSGRREESVRMVHGRAAVRGWCGWSGGRRAAVRGRYGWSGGRPATMRSRYGWSSGHPATMRSRYGWSSGHPAALGIGASSGHRLAPAWTPARPQAGPLRAFGCRRPGSGPPFCGRCTRAPQAATSSPPHPRCHRARCHPGPPRARAPSLPAVPPVRNLSAEVTRSLMPLLGFRPPASPQAFDRPRPMFGPSTDRAGSLFELSTEPGR